MLPQRVEMLDEIQLLANLLQGICLLEGFVSVQDDCRAALRETRVFEVSFCGYVQKETPSDMLLILNPIRS
jgi:hypothetical protein